MSGETRIRVGGVWVEPSDIRYWNGTVWDPISEGYVRHGGKWVRIWPPRAPQTVQTFNAIDTRTWHESTDTWFGYGDAPEQGAHYYGGLHRGCWFYGDRPWGAALAADGGRRIDKIEVYLHRVEGHLGWGSTNAVSPRMWMHGYNTRPSGRPGLFGGPEAIGSFARGEEKWITLPNWWHKYFLDGRARGIAIYTPNGAPIMSFANVDLEGDSGRLRITHS